MKKIVGIFFIISITILGLNAQNKKSSTKSSTGSYLLPPFPSIPAKQPLDSVNMGDSKTFPEVKLDIPIASGPFEPTWESIEKNYPGEPSWLREAKFGIWVHFGPQSAGESGDWYARNLYKPGYRAYENHLKRYGHPSEVGYKDVLRDWNPTKLNPAALTKLYQEAGARFLMIQGVHHDNYDLWNSKYQPWNSVNIGPKRDLIGEWAKACRANGMHFGVTFHHEYTWWWWQTAFGSDKEGAKKGVPYDGNLTLADGKGKWWEGYDPRLLYGIDLREYKGVSKAAASGWSPPPAGIFANHLDYAKWYATQWALRMMDVVEHYDPDFIYTDGTVQGPFTGNGTGTGFKANAMQTVMADYYNRTLKKRGEVNTFSIVKFRRKTNGTVNTEEHGLPSDIKTDQPWIGEAPVGDWFYAPNFTYDSGMMIHYIIEAIARDGNAAISIAILPDGSLDEGSVKMLKQVGVWMRRNGEAVYGSHAWKIPGEGEIVNGKLKQLPGGALNRKQAEFKFDAQDIRFTVGKNGALYAFCMNVPVPGATVRIKSLGVDAKYMDKSIKSVKLLGYNGKLEWKQEADGLAITCPQEMPFATSVVFKVECQ
jgi:alpha-L-fucosidase